MNKFIITFSLMLLLTAITANAQTLQSDNIAGVWVCEEVSMPKDVKVDTEEAAALNVLKAAFVNSKFLFKANGLFEWKFPKGVPAVFQQMDLLNNQKWSVDTKMNIVHIGDPKENLMQISIREKAGIVYFMLSDTPLLLRMRKE